MSTRVLVETGPIATVVGSQLAPLAPAAGLELLGFTDERLLGRGFRSAARDYLGKFRLYYALAFFDWLTAEGVVPH